MFLSQPRQSRHEIFSTGIRAPTGMYLDFFSYCCSKRELSLGVLIWLCFSVLDLHSILLENQNIKTSSYVYRTRIWGKCKCKFYTSILSTITTLDLHVLMELKIVWSVSIIFSIYDFLNTWKKNQSLFRFKLSNSRLAIVFLAVVSSLIWADESRRDS